MLECDRDCIIVVTTEPLMGPADDQVDRRCPYPVQVASFGRPNDCAVTGDRFAVAAAGSREAAAAADVRPSSYVGAAAGHSSVRPDTLAAAGACFSLTDDAVHIAVVVVSWDYCAAAVAGRRR